VEVPRQAAEGPVEKRNHSNITLIDRIRRFLRISKLSLVDMFKQHDNDSVGKVTNLEFRQIMRSLSMGLTTQEID
jgi:Ca2+-binding EF-hand superfamily protein